MKSFVVILAVVAVVAADVSHLLSSDGAAQIVRFESDVGVDKYAYDFETSNGIKGQETGSIKNAGREDEALEVQGSNGYVGPDGVKYEVAYISNENGYQPQGAHFPTPHPIPEFIARSLEYIRTHPPKDVHARK